MKKKRKKRKGHNLRITEALIPLIIFTKDRQEIDFPAIENPAILSNCNEDGTW